jgi:hypothetical protein
MKLDTDTKNINSKIKKNKTALLPVIPGIATVATNHGRAIIN